MTKHDTDVVDQIFKRLAEAPAALDCTNQQVLAALGMLVTGILRQAFSDPTAEAARFCQFLMACVDPARLAQRQSLN